MNPEGFDNPSQPQNQPASVENRRSPRRREIAPHELDWWRAVEAHGPDHPSLIGSEEAAASIGCQPQTVRLWRSRGLGPLPLVVRGRTRYLRREWITWARQAGYSPFFER